MWFGASWEIDAVEVDALRRRATGMLPAKVFARPRLGLSVESAWFDVGDTCVVDVAGGGAPWVSPCDFEVTVATEIGGAGAGEGGGADASITDVGGTNLTVDTGVGIDGGVLPSSISSSAHSHQLSYRAVMSAMRCARSVLLYSDTEGTDVVMGVMGSGLVLLEAVTFRDLSGP